MLIPAERLVKEIEKADFKAEFFMLLESMFGLENIIPELCAMKGVDQGIHHQEGDVFVHTMLVLKNVNNISKDPATTWAALFHNSGKPATKTVSEEGKIQFLGHEDESVKIFQSFAKRMHLPNSLIEEVSFLIANHMRFHYIMEMKPSKRNSLFMHPLFPKLLILGTADECGRFPLNDKLNYQAVKEAYEEFNKEFKVTASSPLSLLKEKGIDGNYALSLGLKGKQISEFLSAMSEYVAEYPGIKPEALKVLAKHKIK